MLARIRLLASVGALFLATSLASPAQAAESAQEFIQSRQTQVTQLVRQAPGTQRDKQVAAVIDGMIDYETLTKRSLAGHWADLSDAQHKEFTDILRSLVRRNYERNIKNILDYRVEYLGEEPGSEESVVVHSRASSAGNTREEPISIDYQLTKMAGGWRVVDVVTEGSSLVNNYKNQFHRIIQKDGYDVLVRRMKEKLAKGQT
ncbi:MAG TPA: ABC transporter substrate-binding protein [Polyangiaceae bacterium]|nr:ABC transporter substrate-binding protein [Polyangiaceae bacterium]